MTPAYALELLRVALDRVMTAAGEIYSHNPPDWMRYRLVHIIFECQSMRDALEAYEIETKGKTK